MTININDIIFNLYITGMPIDSYENISLQCNPVDTHTHTLSDIHITLHILFQNRIKSKNPETKNKQVLESVISFTIHI